MSMPKSNQKPPLRILHIAFTLHDKTLQSWLLHILKLTKSDGVRIDLMTTADEAPVFQSVIEEIGGRILVCPHPKKQGSFLRYLRESLSIRGKYDVIHVHPFILSGKIMMQAFRAGIPARLMHAHLDRRKARRDKTFFRRVGHKISTLLIRRLSTHGLAVNDSAAQDIYGREWSRDGRWQIMPYGLHLSSIKVSEDQNLKAKMGIPPNAKIITQIDDFYFEKNHDLTLQIFEQEARKNLSLVLILAGVGPLRKKIEDQVIKKGLDERVIFLSRDVESADILTVTDLMIAPVLYEHDLLPLLQAQAFGIPILASDQVPQDISMHDTLMNFISLDHDIGVWMKAFDNILAQPRMSIERARGLFENSSYNIERNAAALTRLYQEARQGKEKGA
jgi:glycosyltransferase involved in cell wall biosynthesis